jgi:protease-4
MTQRKISFGRIFWPSFWAAIIVSILGAVIWFIVIGIFFSSFEPKPFEVAEKTVLHVQLNGNIGEKGETKLNPGSFQMETKLGLASILHGLEVAKTDKNVEGVFLEIGDLSCGMATAQEIRAAINDFEESGKWVVVYNSGELVSTKEYYIASAADENYGFPTTNVQFLGLGAELMYFKKALDDLDVEVQVIRGSDNHFKSAVEPFFRESMSDSARLQNERYINSMWQDMLSEIAKDRKLDKKKLNQLADDAAIMDVEDAVKYKLIDAAKYRDEVVGMIAEKLGKKKDDELEFMAFNKYAKKKFYQDQVLTRAKKPNIAVILAEGAVATSGDGLTSEEICKLFKEVREDENIKTVVFRVNSPGGSALASDEIWREVKLTNEKKKVIVSMGDLAASGGYYVSAPASYIFAEPMTITGSIGVFGMIPYTGKMFENKLGLTFDRVATNKHSVMTTNRKLTEDEMLVIQKSVDDIYDQFKGRVAAGRGMTKEQVNVIGRGRVWTGRDALKIGLVDELGGMKDAISYAADKAGIKDQKVVYYPKVKEDKFAELIEQFEEQNESEVKIESPELPNEMLTYYRKLKAVENMQGIQMRLPFSVTFN